jgi:hypothetical protein
MFLKKPIRDKFIFSSEAKQKNNSGNGTRKILHISIYRKKTKNLFEEVRRTKPETCGSRKTL